MKDLAKRCVSEGFGAFMIVLAGCGAVSANQLSNGAIGHAGIAASFGLVVMVMVYATGHISGAHMNPAVTIAFAITRHFPIKELAPYILAQCTGAVLAALVLKATLTPALHDTDLNAILQLGVSLPLDGRWITGVVWEFLLTFVLMFVIMSVATDTRAIGKAAGIVIGGTVWFEAMSAGPICGASMNPARSLGPALIQSDTTLLWVYLIAPTLGAISGGLVYQLLREEHAKPV